MIASMRRLLPIIFAIACGGQASSDAGSPLVWTLEPVDPCEDPPTWDSFAQGWVTSWCTPCHASSLTGADRQGAPVGVDLETLEDVRAWADRVRARSVDAQSMPPGGGPSEASRERLGLFLDCGLPGTTDPADPCDAPVEVPTTHLASQADADALCTDEAVAVRGDLVLTSTIEASCLCEVDGTIEVSAPSATLPGLMEAGALSAGASVERLDLPDLEILGASLELIDRSVLEQVSMPRLVRIEGDLRIVDAPALVRVPFDRLVTIEGDLEVQDVGARGVYLPRLAEVGHVTLAELPVDEAPHLSSLQTVGGDLFLADLAAPMDSGWSSLEQTEGSVRLHRLDTETVSAFFKLTHVGGDLELVDLPQVDSLYGLDAVEVVEGDLVVVDTPELPADDLEAWADGIDVQGQTQIDEEKPRK